MEQFIDKVIKQLPSLKIIEASKGFEAIEEDHDEHHHDHEKKENHGKEAEHHDHDEEVNPHIWVSISGAMHQVKVIAAELSAADPAHAEQYRRNAEAYLSRLEQLRAKMHESLKNIQSRDIIVFHEAFPYFAREFNLKIVGVIEREPGSEPNAKELAETIELVKKAKVRAIFIEPQYPDGSAQIISRETGAKVFNLDPCVTGKIELPQAYDAYTSAMESNLKSLVEALK